MKAFLARIHLPVLLVLAIAVGLSTADEKRATGEEADNLAPLARYVGEWSTRGRWSSGDELRARAVYEWGIGKKFLKARTYVMDGEKEYLRYESVMGWHPAKKSLFDISFAFDGGITENLLTRSDDDTFRIGWTPYIEGQTPKVRQTIKFTGQDAHVWTVEIRKDDGWKQIIESTWRRQPAK